MQRLQMTWLRFAFTDGLAVGSCVETVPWDEALSFQELVGAEKQRPCVQTSELANHCGACLHSFDKESGRCVAGLPFVQCASLNCEDAHRPCDTATRTNACCGACLDGFSDKQGACAPITRCKAFPAVCGEATRKPCTQIARRSAPGKPAHASNAG